MGLGKRGKIQQRFLPEAINQHQDRMKIYLINVFMKACVGQAAGNIWAWARKGEIRGHSPTPPQHSGGIGNIFDFMQEGGCGVACR